MELSLLDTALIALDRLALATIIGCSAALFWLIPNSTTHTLVIPAIRRLLDSALLILIITTGAVLLMRTAIMADVPLTEAFSFADKVVEKSYFGSLWVARSVTLIAMIAVWLFFRKSATPLSGMLLIAGSTVIAFYISAASHAGDEGLATFDNLVNSAHIIGGCLWGGGVIAYLVLIAKLRSAQEMHQTLCDSADRLSTLATVALATVITTGLLNAWHRLENIADLWQTDYGITLMIKLLFVALMMAVGASNRFFIIPAMKTEPATTGRFHRILHLDSLLFISIITIAAALGIQGPGEH